MSNAITLPATLRGQLDAAARRVRLLQTVRGLGLLMVVLTATAGLALLIDWLTPLSSFTRLAAFSLWVGLGLFTLTFKLVLPLAQARRARRPRRRHRKTLPTSWRATDQRGRAVRPVVRNARLAAVDPAFDERHSRSGRSSRRSPGTAGAARHLDGFGRVRVAVAPFVARRRLAKHVRRSGATLFPSLERRQREPRIFNRSDARNRPRGFGSTAHDHGAHQPRQQLGSNTGECYLDRHRRCGRQHTQTDDRPRRAHLPSRNSNQW